MDAREQRGLEIAAKARIERAGSAWLVPSQSDNTSRRYRVTRTPDGPHCTCPDFELRGQTCKHGYAVEIVVKRETVTETTAEGETRTTVMETAAVRVSYPQQWPAYNRAQCAEKEVAQVLLCGLCAGIVSRPQIGRGRPRTPLSDSVYAMAMKVYGGMSARRSTTDIEASMERAPKYNTILEQFDRADLTPLLTALLQESAAPLASVESQFAVDATGFGTVTYRRWYDEKYGRERKEHGWIKAHAMVGTTTNIITAMRVTGSDVHDGPELPALVASTAERFAIREVSADKAYLSHRNLAAIEAVNATPFIAFKSNSQGEGSDAWRRMWGHFLLRQGSFLHHYNARSNVESTFSALKRKFGASVRSKNPTAQANEVLVKGLCHNLSMLVHAMFELGIAPEFHA